jgi:beta-N-acetylhexosaminidase
VRRWLLRLAVVLAFVGGGALVGLLIGSGGSNRRAATTTTRTSIAARPATVTTTATTAPSPPSPAQRLAARLPLDRAVAQLFLVDDSGRLDRDWGGVVVKAPERLDAGRIKPFVVAAPDAVLPSLSQPTITTLAAARDAAAKVGGLLRRDGVNMTLSPSADVSVQGSPVADRAFPGPPAQVAALTGAALDGFVQAHVIAAVGNFPGEGGASADPNQEQATVGGSLQELRTRDLVPFTAVASRAQAMVVSNAIYAGFDGVTPAVLLPAAIQQLLRGQLHFGGVVVSGDLGATVVATGGALGPTAVAALRAGCDLVYVGDGAESAYRAVLAAARSGRLPRARILASLQRVLALKARYGLIR